MNERVRIHFDEIEARLIECPAILSYRIIRRDISPDDGKLRIRSALIEPPGWMYHGLRQYPDAIMPGAAAGCNDES